MIKNISTSGGLSTIKLKKIIKTQSLPEELIINILKVKYKVVTF